MPGGEPDAILRVINREGGLPIRWKSPRPEGHAEAVEGHKTPSIGETRMSRMCDIPFPDPDFGMPFFLSLDFINRFMP